MPETPVLVLISPEAIEALAGGRVNVLLGDPVEWVQPVEWVESDNPDNPPVRRNKGLPVPVYAPTATAAPPVEDAEVWVP